MKTEELIFEWCQRMSGLICLTIGSRAATIVIGIKYLPRMCVLRVAAKQWRNERTSAPNASKKKQQATHENWCTHRDIRIYSTDLEVHCLNLWFEQFFLEIQSLTFSFDHNLVFSNSCLSYSAYKRPFRPNLGQSTYFRGIGMCATEKPFVFPFFGK